MKLSNTGGFSQSELQHLIRILTIPVDLNEKPAGVSGKPKSQVIFTQPDFTKPLPHFPISTWTQSSNLNSTNGFPHAPSMFVTRDPSL